MAVVRAGSVSSAPSPYVGTMLLCDGVLLVATMDTCGPASCLFDGTSASLRSSTGTYRAELAASKPLVLKAVLHTLRTLSLFSSSS